MQTKVWMRIISIFIVTCIHCMSSVAQIISYTMEEHKQKVESRFDSLEQEVHLRQQKIDELNDIVKCLELNHNQKDSTIDVLNKEIEDQRRINQKLSNDKKLTDIRDLRRKYDSLDALVDVKNVEISKLQDEVEEAKRELESLKRKNKRCEENEGMIVSYLVNKYSDINTLIGFYSIDDLRKDRILLHSFSPANQALSRIDSLIEVSTKYNAAYQALCTKFNSDSVNRYIKDLQVYKKYSKVAEICSLLEKYMKANNLAKEIIGDRIKKLEEFKMTTKAMEIERFYRIIAIIEQQQLINQVRFSDYPYLISIMEELIDVKNKNIQGDVQYLLNKL